MHPRILRNPVLALALAIVCTAVVTPDAGHAQTPPPPGETTVEGTLDVIHGDSARAGASFDYFLDGASGRLEIRFSGERPDLLTGDYVRLTGTRVDGALVLDPRGGGGRPPQRPVPRRAPPPPARRLSSSHRHARRWRARRRSRDGRPA